MDNSSLAKSTMMWQLRKVVECQQIENEIHHFLEVLEKSKVVQKKYNLNRFDIEPQKQKISFYSE